MLREQLGSEPSLVLAQDSAVRGRGRRRLGALQTVPRSRGQTLSWRGDLTCSLNIIPRSPKQIEPSSEGAQSSGQPSSVPRVGRGQCRADAWLQGLAGQRGACSHLLALSRPQSGRGLPPSPAPPSRWGSWPEGWPCSLGPLERLGNTVSVSKPFLGAKARVAASCPSPAASSGPCLACGTETREAVPPATWEGFFAVLCSLPLTGCRGRRAQMQRLPGLAHLPAPNPAKQSESS